MNQLFLHIGLHKTATTSLQADLFPQVPSVKYIGRYFGEPVYGESLYDRIIKYSFSPRRPRKKEREQLRRILSVRLKEGNLLLSEEWITSDYDLLYSGHGCRWQEKLYRLSVLLKGFPVKILITTRNKQEAAFSMYCELMQANQVQKYDNFLHFVVSDNTALAFKANYLGSLVQSLFEVSPHYIDINDIKNGSYLNKFTSFFEVEICSNIRRRYARVSDKNGVYLFSEALPYKLARYCWLKVPSRIKTLLLKKHFNEIRNNLRNRFSKKITIPQPNEDEYMAASKFLRN